jgi:hypothetical protein
MARAIENLLLAILFGAPGATVAAWVALTVQRTEKGYDLALQALEWVEAAALLDFGQPAAQLAGKFIQRESVQLAGIGGLVLCAVSLVFLHRFYRCIRPLDPNHGRMALLVLKTQHPRVGQVLEGKLQLKEDVQPGEEFQISLFCAVPGTSRPSSIAFSDSQVRQAVAESLGWSVPFRFELPDTAPPTTTRGWLTDARVWRLTLISTKGVFASTDRFEIAVAPREESADGAVARTTPGPQREALLDAIRVHADALGVPLRPRLLERIRSLPDPALVLGAAFGETLVKAPPDKRAGIVALAAIAALFAAMLVLGLAFQMLRLPFLLLG